MEKLFCFNYFSICQNFDHKQGEKRNALANCKMRGMANACEFIEYFIYQVDNRIEFVVLLIKVPNRTTFDYLFNKIYIFTKIKKTLKCSIF
jgi:hypothetical protein